MIGRTLGPYRVLDKLGAGGMGEVYRARDTKLNRDVALKVLPDAFTHDTDRLARFQREAQVLASLNHPNIAAIYGFEESRSGGSSDPPINALVLELVDGPTLADRIIQGPLSIGEALPIAKQIADALEAAHGQGIVHRDLKPANIKVRDDGTVKVLDFGLAKALAPDPVHVSAGLTQSPTITTPAMTQAGLIMGTAAYMSPEQAKGKPLDKRTDIWAFGCVLYEMLTGRRAFPGEEVSETLASVLAREPDLALLPRDLPPVLGSYLRRCLHKDPRQRVHDIADVRLALEGAFDSSVLTHATEPALRSQRAWQRPGVVALITACVAAAIAGSLAWTLKPSSPLLVMRSRFVLPQGQQFSNDLRPLVALSPDGTQVAYVANFRLFVRRLSELDARPVAGTESPEGPNSTTTPVFSPDGRFLAYYDRGAIKKIPVEGGTAVTLCQGDPPSGMSWSDEFIVIGQGAKGIMRVSANGGRLEQLVSVGAGEIATEPQVLPGNRAVLFTLASSQSPSTLTRWDSAHIVVHALDSSKRTTIIDGSHGRYLPSGHLVYALGGTLFAVPFDAQRLQRTGGAAPVVEGVRRSISVLGSGSAHYSYSATGSLVFVPGPGYGSFEQREIVFVDRKGVTETLPLPQNAYGVLRISPNGRQLAFDTDDGKEANVWIYDLAGGSPPRKLTFAGRNRFPIWSADSRRVVYQSDREGDPGLFWQLADGTGAVERLTKTEKGISHVAESWSPAEERFSFSELTTSGVSLWTYSLVEKKATRFGDLQSTAAFNSEFSPDGRWMAYTLRTANAANIWVEPFPATGTDKHQITTSNGHHALWLPGGEGLTYRVGATGQAAVSVKTSPTFSVGNPMPVVELPTIELGGSRTYDVTRDGRRFLVAAPASAARSGAVAIPAIEIVVNWFEDLKKRVPVP
ncbi:MAG TPA: protein kinase [Gemmatimonadales bacterium]|nr:protein kinase [Gemmatimonadales bacterium]